jgi:hypothetical protein
MSRTTNRLSAALMAVAGVIGTAGAQAPAQVGEPAIAAEVKPQHGGPHRDPPGVQKAFGCPKGWKRVPPGVNPALRCLPDHLVAPSNGRVATLAPQPNCPAGWQPVAPELNPVLRCQPAKLVGLHRGASGPSPPIGCPDGWRPVAPNVSPILRCLPNEIAATPAPGADRVPASGCPKGWKPVPSNVNPLMRCLPDRAAARQGAQPQRTGPDPGEPAQAMPDIARPDP